MCHNQTRLLWRELSVKFPFDFTIVGQLHHETAAFEIAFTKKVACLVWRRGLRIAGSAAPALIDYSFKVSRQSFLTTASFPLQHWWNSVDAARKIPGYFM